LIVLLHQLLKWESSGCGAKGSNPNTEKIAVQTCLANTTNQDMLDCFISLITQGMEALALQPSSSDS